MQCALQTYETTANNLSQHLCSSSSLEIIFLDDRHVLLPVAAGPTGDISLAVFDCYRNIPQNTLLTEVVSDHATLLLQLPSLVDDWVYTSTYTLCVGNTLRPSSQPSQAHVPFHLHRDLRLITLALQVCRYVSVDRPTVLHTQEYDLAIPARTLLSRLPRARACRPPAVHPWASWGAETRFMGAPLMSLYCSRYLAVENVPVDDGGSARVIVVYDFAPVPALVVDAREARARAPGSVPFSVPEPMPLPEVFADRTVQAAAPCRRVVSNVVVAGEQDVRLYEDGFLVFDVEVDSRYVSGW